MNLAKIKTEKQKTRVNFYFYSRYTVLYLEPYLRVKGLKYLSFKNTWTIQFDKKKQKSHNLKVIQQSERQTFGSHTGNISKKKNERKEKLAIFKFANM
jgi:hypothetical protein